MAQVNIIVKVNNTKIIVFIDCNTETNIMSAAATYDGKNRNPIVFDTSKNTNVKDFELSRRQRELDESVEDEIDNYEGTYIHTLTPHSLNPMFVYSV